MKYGPIRFDYYLGMLEALLNKAATQKDPGLWLYNNNARTTLFMLEGLSKMYIDIHNGKKFSKLKEQFKLLEDALGKIDYYDTIAKDLKLNNNIPVEISKYLQGQCKSNLKSFNELLVKKEWISDGNKRITKIHKKLANADWEKEKEEIANIEELYGKAIYEIVEFVQKTKFHFDNVETDVHELRRKLRWLSIYPQTLRGSIQLTKMTDTPAHLAKYLTEEIITSPFNVLPDAGNCKYFLLLNQDYFYALSWMIAELGKIKDNGLHLIALKEALMATAKLPEDEAYLKACTLLNTDQSHIQVLLDTAEAICKTYFDEQNLEHLVIGVTSVKETAK